MTEITFETVWNSYFSMEQIQYWIKGGIVMIRCGDRVKDKVTGFTGIVIGITTWLNGCVRAGIQSEAFKDGRPIEPYYVDVGQLEVLMQQVLEPGGRTEPLDTPGGPTPTPKRAPDPKR